MKDMCLSDDQLAAYVDGVVRPETRKRIEDHLARCGLCLHNVAELKQLVSSEQAEKTAVPERALARAESIIAERVSSLPQFEIAVALKSGMCKLLATTGDLLMPRKLAAVPIRGAKHGATSVRVAKSVSGYLVTAEFAAAGDAIQPKVTLVEESSSARPDGVKAKLYSPGACETKYSRHGKVNFSPVKQGFFRIDIEDVGRIKLEVK